jgi:hypothetical protein
MEEELRSARTLPTRKLDQEQITLAGTNSPAWIKEGCADKPAEVTDPNNDREPGNEGE